MNDGDIWIGMMFGFIISILTIVIIVWLADPGEESYKRGQVDAMNGKIEYFLYTHPDSTKTWEKHGYSPE